jgi:hypothetical protein
MVEESIGLRVLFDSICYVCINGFGFIGGGFGGG